MKVKSLCCVRLLATPWTAAYQAPPSMGFSRQEYWSGLPLSQLEKDKYCMISLICGIQTRKKKIHRKRDQSDLWLREVNGKGEEK